MFVYERLSAPRATHRTCERPARMATWHGIKGRHTTKGLVSATVRRDLSHKQFTRSVLRNKSQGLVPKLQTTLNKSPRSLRLELKAKMASSHDGTCPRDFFQGLVAGTGPSCLPTSKLLFRHEKVLRQASNSVTMLHIFLGRSVKTKPGQGYFKAR